MLDFSVQQQWCYVFGDQPFGGTRIHDIQLLSSHCVVL